MRRFWRPIAVGLVLLGVWIVVVPYHRVIPGGDVADLARTPQVACGPALVAAFRGGDDALVLPGDNTGPVVVADEEGYCQSRGQFRLAFGLLAAAAGVAALVVGPRAWGARRPAGASAAADDEREVAP